jgi:superfamily II DNA or RNA helicase
MATAIIKDAVAKYQRVLFIAHRDELITQAADKLRRFGDLVPGIIKAGRDKDQRPQALVQVASVQTLHARAFRSKSMELPPAEILVIDEAHHSRARTYQQIIDAYPNAIVLGLTATPCRGDGRGLGNIFETLIECPQIGELIKLERLVRPKIYAPAPPDLRGVHIRHGDYVINELSQRVNTDVLVGDIVLEWLKRSELSGPGCPLCANNRHSQMQEIEGSTWQPLIASITRRRSCGPRSAQTLPESDSQSSRAAI